jgi:hypothetical protein
MKSNRILQALAILMLTSCQMAIVNTGKQKRTAVDGSKYVIIEVIEMTETNIRPCDTCRVHRYFIKAAHTVHSENEIRFTTYEMPSSDTLTVQVQ